MNAESGIEKKPRKSANRKKEEAFPPPTFVWENFSLQRAYDLLGEILGEELGLKITYTITEPEDEQTEENIAE